LKSMEERRLRLLDRLAAVSLRESGEQRLRRRVVRILEEAEVRRVE